jgi:cell division septation protein DedD
MFRLPLVAAAVSAALGFISVAEAQTVREIRAPAELPPAGYAGRHYVDSRGCLFFRAEANGRVSWVPRVGDDRLVMCNYRPTFAARRDDGARVAAAAPPPAPAPAPRAPAPPPPAPPPATAASVRDLPLIVHAGSPADYIVPGPLPPRDGSAAPAAVADRPARLAAGAAAGADLRPPPGYRAAWTDGRLNPERGPRTAEGDAQMARIWTRETPMQLVSGTEGRAGAAAAGAPGGQATARASARNAPAAAPAPAPAAAGRLWVQVGTYGEPANARAAVARLQGQGLGAATQALTRNGRVLTVVLAGPFADPRAQAQAVALVRAAGFADAFARN